LTVLLSRPRERGQSAQMDAQRALLDSLLGTDRNAKEGTKKQSFKDEDVCKHYLVGDCPHDMFVNQDGKVAVNSPIGACRKQHSEAMRMRFKEHEDYRKYRWRYLRDLQAQLQRLVDDNDKKAKAVKQKLAAGTSAGFETCETVASHMEARDMLVSEKLEAAEKMAEEGDMETSQNAMKAVEELTHQRYRLARLKEVAEAWVDEVCWTCGYQISWRSVEELEARDKGRPHPHTMGSWHGGWVRVRQALTKVDNDIKACREAGHAGADDWYKDGDEKGPDRDRDRDREKDKDRDRDRDREKEKEKGKDANRDKDRDRDRNKDKSVEREKDADRSKDKDKERDRDRDRDRGRSKSGDRERARDKAKSKDKRSRSRDRSRSRSRKDKQSRSRDRSRSRSRKAARKRSASKDRSRRRSASKRDRKRSASRSRRRSSSRKKDADKKSKEKKSKGKKSSSRSASKSRKRSKSRKKDKDKKSKAKKGKEKKARSSSGAKSSSRSRSKSAAKAKEKEKSKGKDKKEKEKEKKKSKKVTKKSSTSSSS